MNVLIAILVWSVVGSSPAINPPRGRVTIVGVTHAPSQFWHESFSPGHVRACLETLKPDVVCVESNPEWFAQGRYYRQTYEVRLAVDWARQADLPVYGVDWIGDDEMTTRAEINRISRIRLEHGVTQSGTPEARHYRYGHFRASDATPPADETHTSFAELNSDAYGQHWTSWIDAGKDEPGSAAEYMDRRDRRIADHVRDVLARHPGSHIMLIIGAAHKADLERLLVADSIAIGSASLTPAASAMDNWLRPEDMAAILHEGLDTGRRHVVLERLRRLERRLADSGPQAAAWSMYFRARIAQLEGRADAAAVAFETSQRLGLGVQFPHSGDHWRSYLTVAQAARLELGRLEDVAGQRRSAVRHYQVLLDSLPTPPYDEDYHSDYLYLAIARNAIGALIAQPYRVDLPYEPPQTSVAVRGAGGAAPNEGETMILRQAFAHNHAHRYDESIKLLTALVDRESLAVRSHCEALYLLAAAYVGRGDAEQGRLAVAHLREVSAAVPTFWTHRELPALETRLAALQTDH